MLRMSSANLLLAVEVRQKKINLENNKISNNKLILPVNFCETVSVCQSVADALKNIQVYVCHITCSNLK